MSKLVYGYIFNVLKCLELKTMFGFSQNCSYKYYCKYNNSYCSRPCYYHGN